MAKISHQSIIPLTLPTGHVVPRAGTLETTNDVIRSPDNWPMLKAMSLSGDVLIELDPDAPPPPEARSWTEVPDPFMPKVDQIITAPEAKSWTEVPDPSSVVEDVIAEPTTEPEAVAEIASAAEDAPSPVAKKKA